MSSYVHPDVKTRNVIADNWWRERGMSSRESSRTKTPHDAQASTRLVATSSLAVQDPYSDEVVRFVKWYRRAQTTDIHGMSDDKLESELWKYLIDIDEMFFFSLLSRKVEQPSGMKSLVRVRVISGSCESGWCGAYKKEGKSPTIRIWRINKRRGEPWSFEHLIYVLAHEMCHAYLDIFTDKRHPKHQEWVNKFNGHGEMFWVLLRFISRQMGSYLRSEAWRKELDAGEAECYELTNTRGEPGSWGTPERTLQGGVLGP
ncbi:hypothetical protein F5Y03DRAFT_406648 [Xylaria venustula]|nr:hypothetical protein F5Y03DRAFT_406648 [Xylaria venustula]